MMEMDLQTFYCRNFGDEPWPSQLAGGEKACSASLVEKDERVEKVEKDES